MARIFGILIALCFANIVIASSPSTTPSSGRNKSPRGTTSKKEDSIVEGSSLPPSKQPSTKQSGLASSKDLPSPLPSKTEPKASAESSAPTVKSKGSLRGPDARIPDLERIKKARDEALYRNNPRFSTHLNGQEHKWVIDGQNGSAGSGWQRLQLRRDGDFQFRATGYRKKLQAEEQCDIFSEVYGAGNQHFRPYYGFGSDSEGFCIHVTSTFDTNIHDFSRAVDQYGWKQDYYSLKNCLKELLYALEQLQKFNFALKKANLYVDSSKSQNPVCILDAPHPETTELAKDDNELRYSVNGFGVSFLKQLTGKHWQFDEAVTESMLTEAGIEDNQLQAALIEMMSQKTEGRMPVERIRELVTTQLPKNPSSAIRHN